MCAIEFRNNGNKKLAIAQKGIWSIAHFTFLIICSIRYIRHHMHRIHEDIIKFYRVGNDYLTPLSRSKNRSRTVSRAFTRGSKSGVALSRSFYEDSK